MKIISPPIALILVLIASSCQPSEELHSKGKTTIITIGEFEVDLSELESKFSHINDSTSGVNTLDQFISAGLMYHSAQKQGYLDLFEIKKELRVREQALIKELLKIQLMKDQNIESSNAEVKASYDRFKNKILQVDYVYVPIEEREICLQIQQSLEAGLQIKELRRFQDIEEWIKTGVKFKEKRQIHPGTFTDEIARELLSMQTGETKTLRTKTSFHVFKLTNITSFPQEYNSISEDIRNRLQLAKLNIEYDYVFDKNTYDDGVHLDMSVIKHLDIICDPMQVEGHLSDFIAYATDDSIGFSAKWLRERVANLPMNVQSLFRNKSTRIQAVESLIMLETGSIPVPSGIMNTQKLSLIAEHLTQILKKESEPQSSINHLTLYFQQLTSSYKNNGLLELIENELKVNSEPELYDIDLSDPISYKSPERFAKINQLRLYHPKIQEIEFQASNDYQDHDEVLAYTNDWHLKISTFLDEINQLTSSTRLKLTEEYSITKLVEYLYKKDHFEGNVENLKINWKLMDYIDLIGMSIDETNNYNVTEKSAIARFQDTELSVGELRERVSSLPLQKKKQLLRNNKIQSFLIDLVIFKHLQNNFAEEIARVKVSKKFESELRQLRQNVLISHFYHDQVYIDRFYTGNEKLDWKINAAIWNLNNQRLDSCINRFAKEYKIKANCTVLNELEIDLADSKFKNFITCQN